jgi:hypothetical protein
VLGALLIERLGEFVVLVFPLGGLGLNHGLKFGTADLPAFGLFNLDAKGVVQAFDLFKVLAGTLLEGGHVGAVFVDHSGEALYFESGLAVVGLQGPEVLLPTPQLVPHFVVVFGQLFDHLFGLAQLASSRL